MIELEEKSDSLDEMLRQIKKIMSEDMAKESGDKKNEKPNGDDVLELLESSIVEDNIQHPSAPTDLPKQDTKVAEVNSGDVLQDIDSLLGEKKIEQPTQVVTSEVKKDPIDDIFNAMSKTTEIKPEPTLTDASKSAFSMPNIAADVAPVQLPKSEVETPEVLPKAPEVKEVAAEVAVAGSEEKSSETFAEENPVPDTKAKSSSQKVNRLVSSEVEAESIEAIKSLIKSVEKPLSDGLSFRSGVTMEQLVIEMIKPKLSDWLDVNLPGIVKHVVEKEVKRLIPKDDD